MKIVDTRKEPSISYSNSNSVSAETHADAEQQLSTLTVTGKHMHCENFEIGNYGQDSVSSLPNLNFGTRDQGIKPKIKHMQSHEDQNGDTAKLDVNFSTTLSLNQGISNDETNSNLVQQSKSGSGNEDARKNYPGNQYKTKMEAHVLGADKLTPEIPDAGNGMKLDLKVLSPTDESVHNESQPSIICINILTESNVPGECKNLNNLSLPTDATKPDLLQHIRSQISISRPTCPPMDSNSVLKIRNERGSFVPLSLTTMKNYGRSARHPLIVEICSRHKPDHSISSIDSTNNSVFQLSKGTAARKSYAANNVCREWNERLSRLEMAASTLPRSRSLFLEVNNPCKLSWLLLNNLLYLFKANQKVSLSVKLLKKKILAIRHQFSKHQIFKLFSTMLS